jgi:hypothetical protein
MDSIGKERTSWRSYAPAKEDLIFGQEITPEEGRDSISVNQRTKVISET